MNNEKFSLAKGYVTHRVPTRISSNNQLNSDSLVSMKGLIYDSFQGNSQAAALCVTLALIEASQKGEPVEPTEKLVPDEGSQFNWIEGGTKEVAHSISYTINILLEDEFSNDSEFKTLVQHTLLPRGLELLEELDDQELCDFFLSVLDN